MAMKWTPDRPEEPGNYWFRLAENKPPQAVTVRGDKVTFRSGKTKHISLVQGQWGDAISSSVEVMSEHSSSSSNSGTWLNIIVKQILPVIVALVVGALWSEPYLTHDGEEKGPEVAQDMSTNPHRISITVFPIFRNWGLRPGHIEGVEFSPRELHLYPEDLKLNYCDKAPITLLSIFSGKTIICNYVASIDPKKVIKAQVWFQVFYIVPGGHALAPVTYSVNPMVKPP